MRLVRRDAQLDLIERHLTAARRGGGGAVLVTGSPGTGKSALLRAFAERAGDSGALVLDASASPAETDLPFGVAGQLLSGAGRDAGHHRTEPPPPRSPARPVVPGKPGDDPAVLHEVLRELAATAPVVVLVDDAHHMDEVSARCLLYVCGRLAANRILLVMSGPPRPRSRPPLPLPLAELLRHPRCTPVPLAPLDEDGVAAFLTASPGGAADLPTARRLAPDWHRFTGGNPRLLCGLLDDHRDCEPVRPSRPVAGTAFRRAVTGCLRGAGDPAVSAARALAVLADAATLTLLARLLELPERAVGPCLAELDAIGLLDGGRLRHEGVRAAVLEELSARESNRLHTTAGRMLYENGAEPASVARHLVAADTAGGGPGPAWAVPLLAEAARHAMSSGGARQAAEFLRTAHRAGGHEAAGLLTALARAEWEADPAAVIRHLPALGRTLAGARWQTAEDTAGAMGLLLWHGRPAEVARALPETPRPDGADGADGTGGVDGAGGVGGPAAALAYVYPGTGVGPYPYDGSGERPSRHSPHSPHSPHSLHSPYPPYFPYDDRGDARDADGMAELRDEAAERVLASIVYDHAPPAPVAAVLSALLHTGETGRAARWCGLTAGGDRTGATTARRAVAAAAAAVVHGRTGAYDIASGHAERALSLMSPGAWGVAIGMPLSAAVLAATRRGAHEEAVRWLRVPVPAAMFRTRAGLHYLLARGHHQLAVGRPKAALGDFHACRDVLSGWRPELRGAVDWDTPAADALRALRGEDTGNGDPIAGLTDAERRVAVLAADGCTNRAIAARLYVTTSTVEQHLTRVYRKLCVKSRGDLAHLVTARPH
ncbi:AAA family ATPase [Streptomyces sp. NPDC056045]|uniref:AAA family ATPase n=1 Tax=Streptomyces sp. NPDC056045 TaxID=3345691 RepID=UPI0035D91F0F